MSAPKKKPIQPAEEKPLDDQPTPSDEQEQPDAAPDEAEQPAEAPEPSEEVRKFVAMIHSHTHTHGKQFEPACGVVLQFGYNGLLRVHGHGHVHVATLDELAEMSDQQVYDAVMAAGKRR